MKVVVTGADGFVGRAIVAALVRQGGCAITAADTALDRDDVSGSVDYVEGSIVDPLVRARALSGGCDALVHLTTVPGGAAEQDPELAKQINLDASIALIDEVSQMGKQGSYSPAASPCSERPSGTSSITGRVSLLS